MSAWRPRTTALGGLPNISHVPRIPEPLGTEFKCPACPATGCMVALEIQRGREGMKDDPMQVVSICVDGDNEDVSQMNSTLTSSVDTSVIKILRTLTDANNKLHRLVKLPKKKTENSKHKGTMARKCKLCQERGVRHDVVYYCFDCGDSSNYCSIDQHNKTRDCFMEHVRSIKRHLPNRRAAKNFTQV